MNWNNVQLKNDKDFFQARNQQTRMLSWPEASREAVKQALEIDCSVFVMGEGVDDPYASFGITRDLHKEFGKDRSFDTPIAEAGLMGIAVGAAQAGMRPVFFHNRPDFLYLALDQLANHGAKWSYMFRGKVPVPLVVWSCIGRGWAGSGAQHSQAPQAIFTHIPGMKVIMPSNCYDAKGLMLSAIYDKNPVVFIDHRYNFKLKGNVPEEPYLIPLGKGIVRKEGCDVTVVATSYLVEDSLKIAEELSTKGISVEVIDPRTLKPLDEELILNSVAKTGRLVVVDTGWKTSGFAAEVAALVVEKAFHSLKAPIQRLTAPDTPTPSGFTLEQGFYKNMNDIIRAVNTTLQQG